MAKINCLTKEIAQKIAAGEVVERPASVVKELLENAIDAGATEITVEIQHGGVRYIRLTDNGCGIAREDVPTAFLSHATSKICKVSDLDEIMTLGFRGEALPSIAAVSKMEMMTKQREDFAGTRIVLEGGSEVSLDEAGCPNGTTIIVRDLFFNTPARMKFLKSDRAEGMAVSALLDHLALSHPEIAFCFIKDGKIQTRTPGKGDLYATIYALYGKDFAETLLPVQYALEGVAVHGFVSKPYASRGSNSMQHFFVNNRYFKTRTGSAALLEAYKNSVMVGRYPAAVLFVDVNPRLIDVNVHPAKTEVRFSNERALFNCIYSAAKSGIEADHSKKEAVLSSKKTESASLFQKAQPTGEQLTLSQTAPAVKQKQETANPTTQTAHAVQNTATFTEKPNHAEISAYEQVLKTTVRDSNTTYETAVGEDLPDLSVPTAQPKMTEASAPVSQKTEESDQKKAETPLFATEESVVAESLEDILLNNPKIETENPPAEPKAEPEVLCKTVSEETTETDALEAPEQAAEDCFASQAAQESVTEDTAPVAEKEMQVRVLGEVFKTYILAEVDGELYIIDKHAAHERMLFNRLKKDNGANGAQMLLTPVTVTLSKEEYAVLTEHMELLTKAGFMAEDFGEGTILLRACPLNLEGEDLTALVTEIAGYLLRHKRDTTPEQLDWVYHSIACRAAIKAGYDLKPYEMEHFTKELLKHEEIRFCPHGRPVMVALTKQELDRQFGRLG